MQETIVIEEGEKTLEDRIEEQRAKLHREGKQGTPVNEETLAKWKADRKAKKLAEERRQVRGTLSFRMEPYPARHRRHSPFVLGFFLFLIVCVAIFPLGLKQLVQSEGKSECNRCC